MRKTLSMIVALIVSFFVNNAVQAGPRFTMADDGAGYALYTRQLQEAAHQADVRQVQEAQAKQAELQRQRDADKTIADAAQRKADDARRKLEEEQNKQKSDQEKKVADEKKLADTEETQHLKEISAVDYVVNRSPGQIVVPINQFPEHQISAENWRRNVDLTNKILPNIDGDYPSFNIDIIRANPTKYVADVYHYMRDTLRDEAITRSIKFTVEATAALLGRQPVGKVLGILVEDISGPISFLADSTTISDDVPSWEKHLDKIYPPLPQPLPSKDDKELQFLRDQICLDDKNLKAVAEQLKKLRDDAERSKKEADDWAINIKDDDNQCRIAQDQLSAAIAKMHDDEVEFGQKDDVVVDGHLPSGFRVPPPHHTFTGAGGGDGEDGGGNGGDDIGCGNQLEQPTPTPPTTPSQQPPGNVNLPPSDFTPKPLARPS